MNIDNYEIFNPKYTTDNIYKKFSIDDINNRPNILIEYLLKQDKSKKIRWLYCLSKLTSSSKTKKIYDTHLNNIEYIGVLLKS